MPKKSRAHGCDRPERVILQLEPRERDRVRAQVADDGSCAVRLAPARLQVLYLQSVYFTRPLDW